MARRKKRNGGRRGISRFIDPIFEGLGLLIALGPEIEVLATDLPAGNFQSIPNDSLFAYTGLGGTTQWNQQAAVKGLGAVAGGGLVASIPKIYRFTKRIFRGR